MKQLLCVLMVVVLIVSGAALAAERIPSITVEEIIMPEDVTYDDGFKVYVTPLEENSLEEKVFKEIASFVQEKPIVEYFAPETVDVIVEKLPESVVATTLVMDEFFPIKEMGYQETYGDVEIVFQFATRYRKEDTVVAVVGIPIEKLMELGLIDIYNESEGMIWIPLETQIIDGKVKIVIPENIMREISTGYTVMTVLRAENE